MLGLSSVGLLARLDMLVIGSIPLVVTGFGWANPVPVNPCALQWRTPASGNSGFLIS
jgi:hypothetical protein